MQTEMVSSISLGTLLRQRYLIKQVLGQGGFGRTYLAIDQERFNEPCVLKEFTVPYQDDDLVEKAKALFQREASTLHQIQHPQIPRFWAAFEDEQRLFLVQDFVKGQTYRGLLQARKQKGQAFSEIEVLHFLNHLLPVLSYLHDRDIVHRDISPENIILRSSQQGVEQLFGQPADEMPLELPVLIDFGAVKEAASHWPIVSNITRVGKVGYAPPEQLQTGNVSPHSDLYALGATSLVLLTGREPQALLDSQTLAWHWQPYAKISELLALVLQKMLALQPGDRYQSARETWADLQPLMEEAMQSTLLNSMLPSPGQMGDREIAPASRDNAGPRINATVKTQLHRTANSQEGVTPSQSPEKVSLSQPRRPRHQGIGAGSAIAASLLAILGIGAHLFKVTLPLGSTQQTISLRSSKEALSNAVPFGDSQPQRIEFPSGEASMVMQGNLQDDPKIYVLEATQGQLMAATLEGSSGVVMNLMRANRQGIDTAAYQTRSWTGRLPATEQYTIQVIGNGVYSLDVSITPLSRSDYLDTQAIKFDRGKSATTVTGKVSASYKRQYLLKARSRQIVAVKVVKGDVSFSAIAPDGQRIGDSSKSREWQGRLRTDGEYTIEVSSARTENFALLVEVY